MSETGLGGAFFAFFLKKVSKKFGGFKKTPYLCTRNSERELNEALEMMHP